MDLSAQHQCDKKSIQSILNEYIDFWDGRVQRLIKINFLY